MTTILIEPENTFRIDTVWMAISVDEQGNEGLCAMFDGKSWFPLIASDEKRLEWVIRNAKLMAKNSRNTIKIIKFTTREEIEVISGGAAN